MPDLDRDAILKEMGITQWVLRDPQGSSEPPVGSGPAAPVESPALEAEAPSESTDAPTAPAPEPVAPDSEILTLDSLRSQVADCTACELSQSRSNTVFGEGPGQADWMFVGEAPGQQEDLQGRPFVGRAGSLLTQMLLALGLKREQVFIANTLKCRPPSNRDPQPQELQACEKFLLAQIELVQPEVMVALGRFSAQALTATEQPLSRLRGRVYQYGPAQIPLVVTYHPAYLLRQPADKGKVWADLLLAHRQLPV